MRKPRNRELSNLPVCPQLTGEARLQIRACGPPATYPSSHPTPAPHTPPKASLHDLSGLCKTVSQQPNVDFLSYSPENQSPSGHQRSGSQAGYTPSAPKSPHVTHTRSLGHQDTTLQVAQTLGTLQPSTEASWSPLNPKIRSYSTKEHFP